MKALVTGAASGGCAAVRARLLSERSGDRLDQDADEPAARHGLRADTVSPAAIDAPIRGDFVHASGERARREIALTGRPGRAEEAAAAVCFLLRLESEWIGGVDLPVDGGLGAVLETAARGHSGPRLSAGRSAAIRV